MARRALLSKTSAVALLGLVIVLGLCSFQFGDRRNLNSMPYAQVEDFVSDLERAQQLAKQGNIELFAGDALPGKIVSLRGELSDGNCYLVRHAHGYDHAFCAKLCVAGGSPLLFISDEGGQVYFVLTPQNARRIPDRVLDQIGVPGISLRGKIIAKEVRVFALEGLDQSTKY